MVDPLIALTFSFESASSSGDLGSITHPLNGSAWTNHYGRRLILWTKLYAVVFVDGQYEQCIIYENVTNYEEDWIGLPVPREHEGVYGL